MAKQGMGRIGRRRAVVLGLVQLVLILHILWWFRNGEAIAPLEPSEGMAFAQKGEINPGLLLLALAALATMLFGRFFCGWGCHVLALQDGARWLLMKLGIRPRPFRSRLLRLVPILAFVYMFLWPFILRLWAGEPQPGITDFRWTTHAFWATFPGPFISILTLLLGGGAVIYLLGSKAYCSYACPYGALFGAADALAPGRIRVNDDCQQCARCTAACSSDVRVHEEVRDFGTVMDAACMKCLDCVSACPNDALRFGFGAPAMLTKARARGRRSTVGVPSWDRELILALGYALGFFSSYRLYGSVPLLLALAVGMVGAWALDGSYRLLHESTLRHQGRLLKIKSRLTPSGFAVAVFSLLFLAASGHGLLLRHHERLRDQAWERYAYLRNQVLMEGAPEILPSDVRAAAVRAAEEARWLEDHGLFPQALNVYAIAWEHLLTGDKEAFEAGVQEVLELRPGFGEVLFQFGYYLHTQARDAEALATWASISPRDARYLDAMLAQVLWYQAHDDQASAQALLDELEARGFPQQDWQAFSRRDRRSLGN